MSIKGIKNWINSIIHINAYKRETDMAIEILERTITEIKQQQANQYEGNYKRLLEDTDKLKLLNLKMSMTPVVWGSEERLNISDKAAVSTCLFNTNSGSIRIGDYTFTGSGVSLLAGSHDAETAGFLRRDVEFKSGFDIDIGKGVWIGSNSTLLGPCIVEDDAVIAAGSVVIPRTHIKSGEMFAGVPARKVKDINIIRNPEMSNVKLLELVEREKGLLFYSGWTEKTPMARGDRIVYGHWTDGKESSVYTNLEKAVLSFIVLECTNTIVQISTNDNDVSTFYISNEFTDIEIPIKSNSMNKVIIKTNNKAFVYLNE